MDSDPQGFGSPDMLARRAAAPKGVCTSSARKRSIGATSFARWPSVVHRALVAPIRIKILPLLIEHHCRTPWAPSMEFDDDARRVVGGF